MACNNRTGIPCGSTSSSNCPSKDGCPQNRCPDFTIKRHDTKPDFKVSVSDCDGPLDLSATNLIAEVNMWALAKLKSNITAEDEYFPLANNVGFEQIMVGDILVMDRVRLPEKMLVTAFDETNKLVKVERAYGGTTASDWKRGTVIKIFRVLNGTAEIQSVLRDILQEDGSTLTDQLSETFLVYTFQSNDTCLPGCYWLEFKLLSMTVEHAFTSFPDIIPSFTSADLSPSDFGCDLGDGVEWVRRFPSEGSGFLIKIVDSPTTT